MLYTVVLFSPTVARTCLLFKRNSCAIVSNYFCIILTFLDRCFPDPSDRNRATGRLDTFSKVHNITIVYAIRSFIFFPFSFPFSFSLVANCAYGAADRRERDAFVNAIIIYIYVLSANSLLHPSSQSFISSLSLQGYEGTRRCDTFDAPSEHSALEQLAKRLYIHRAIYSQRERLAFRGAATNSLRPSVRPSVLLHALARQRTVLPRALIASSPIDT